MNRSRYALGAMFLGALGLQVTHKEFFDRLVPGYLDKYRDEVAVAFLIPGLRGVARICALGVLLPSLPEAVNQVRQPDRMREAGVPPQIAIARVPVQCLVIFWVLRATRRSA
jgi:uncharacterized membrane protein